MSATIERPDPSAGRSRTGASKDQWSGVQVLTACLIYQRSGRPKFEGDGRSDTSTHTLLFNKVQKVDDGNGNPFTSVTCYVSDVKLGDRVVRQVDAYTTYYYRVDNVIDIAGQGDHFEARMTLILPGQET